MSHGNIAIFVPHMGCPHKCSFCDQHIISGEAKAPSAGEVTETLLRAQKEMRSTERQLAFFGGSFTAIDRDCMESLLAAAKPFVENDFLNGGIRVSTRPDAIDDDVCRLLFSYGVRSVELGAQSMDDRVLALNGRGHTALDVERASHTIKENGLSLGLQMMTGLYASTFSESIETAEKLIRLSPETVRIYPTVVLRGTRLDELRKSGEYAPPGLEETVEVCAQLLEMFMNAGIAVIRLGLHASREIEEKMTGGAYHPALRELCESRLMLKRARQVLKNKGENTLIVAPGFTSKMTGQHRCNLSDLKREGFICRVCESADIAPFEIKVTT